jgi:NagD protein
MTRISDSDPALGEKLARVRHVFLDLDGTLYLGGTLFPFTRPFLQALDERGIGYTLLTNNPSESVEQYLAKLRGMGIAVAREQLYTSTLATIDHLKSRLPAARRLFILGTPGMIADFEAAGYESAGDSPEQVPHAVVVGFDRTLAYDRLCRAAWWISQGLPWVATNPDRVCPTDRPTVLVDCGSICAALEAATGRAPDHTLGKPDPAMIAGILARRGLRPEQAAMVGDRLYTDIEMARRAGTLGVLVLTGETTAEAAERSAVRPDLICENVLAFCERLPKKQLR